MHSTRTILGHYIVQTAHMSHIFRVCEKNGEILVISGREKLYVGVWSLLWSLMWPTVKKTQPFSLF